MRLHCENMIKPDEETGGDIESGIPDGNGIVGRCQIISWCTTALNERLRLSSEELGLIFIHSWTT